MHYANEGFEAKPYLPEALQSGPGKSGRSVHGRTGKNGDKIMRVFTPSFVTLCTSVAHESGFRTHPESKNKYVELVKIMGVIFIK